MLVFFVLLGIAAIASSLALFRYVLKLLHELPASNDDFGLEMIDSRPPSPSGAAGVPAGITPSSARAAYSGETI